jgi:2-C-methyl-D-erythritol 4-phosphate cytidylyltransferase
MLSWTLQALLSERTLAGVVVALAPNDRRWARLPESREARVRTCVGGARREVSVAAGLEALVGIADEADWILVHDAARPCLARDDLRRLLNALARDPVGGLLATPVSDTLKRADDKGCVRNTVDREGLWRAGTPQMFRFGVLRRGLAFCRDRKRPVTDEASAVEALGLRPRLVTGRSDNLKVTTAADAKLAAVILAAQMRKSR